MGYKAKVVVGLLAATCVFSIIALILSVVNVKDVFLPPRTKVGSLGAAQLPARAWAAGCPLVQDFPQVSGRLCCLSPPWGQTARQAGVPGGSGRVWSL